MKFDEEILKQLIQVNQWEFGKNSNHVSSKRKYDTNKHNWAKKCIFFWLEYRSKLKLRHNLDVIHIKKNICDSILGTLLNIDQQFLTSHLMRSKLFCSFIKSVNFLVGYVANLSHNMKVKVGKVLGLKTHDYHVLMQILISVGIWGILDKNVCST